MPLEEQLYEQEGRALGVGESSVELEERIRNSSIGRNICEIEDAGLEESIAGPIDSDLFLTLADV